MGETCDICGRTEQECHRLSGQLATMGCTQEEELDCYRIGFARLRSLYREWQEAVDRAADKAARAEADKDHAQLRWRELRDNGTAMERLLKRAAEELYCGCRGIALGRNAFELLTEIEFLLGAREEDRRASPPKASP